MKILKWILGSKSPIPENLKFAIGQKVATSVTHEVNNSIIGVGVIFEWSHKAKSYWAFSDTPSNWYKVKMNNGSVITYPEERLTDLIESTERWRKHYERDKDKIGQYGFSLESACRIQAIISESETFLQK